MSARPDIRVLHHAGDIVGESPLWAPDDNAVWWVDIAGRAVRRLDLATGSALSRDLPIMPGALALDGAGKVVVAGGTGWHRLGSDGSSLTRIAAAPGAAADMRMNDGTVDHAGRFWAGTVPLQPSTEARGRLYCLDRRGARVVLDGLRTQNGTAVSPDGRTFYLADSHPDVRTIWAFDLDLETAALSNRRVFHRPSAGRPDGAAIDAEGCYWFAAIDAGRIVRLDPKGREIRAIPLPVSRPTNIAFCGPDLGTLCVTTMSAGLHAARRAAEPLAGALLAVEAGARGWPQPRFSSLPAAASETAGALGAV